MTKNIIHIGIDGDVDKSGYAELHKSPFAGKWTIQYLNTLDFFDVLEKLQEAKTISQMPDTKLTVFIEGGWLNKSIHHTMKSNAHGAKIGEHVGANHQIGKLFARYCERIGLPYQLYLPSSSKWNAKIFQQVTGSTLVTCQEKRDAVRAGWT